MKEIEALDPKVRACIRKRGFTALSDAQKQAIPLIREGKNVVLIAPTGTGKTESAMFPVFNALALDACRGRDQGALYHPPALPEPRYPLPDAVVVQRTGPQGRGPPRGHPACGAAQAGPFPPDLLITTPETLQALFMGKRLRKHLANVRFVIIDEIHELAGSKRGAQLAVALERLVVYAGEFQRIGLSATVGNPDDIARFLCGRRPFSIVQVPVAKQLDIAVKFVGDDFQHQTRASQKRSSGKDRPWSLSIPG